jgi:hypothetical protein
VFFGVPLAAQAQFSYTTINGTFTITGYTGPGGSVTIPSSINGVMVTGLGDHAFDEFLGNTGPSSVTIPDTVSNIGNYVFSECLDLTNVSIGNGVISIGSNAFNFCPRLNTIAAGSLNLAYTSVDGILFNKNQSSLIQFPPGKSGTYSIPASVTSIGYNAFSGCTKLTSVTMPDSVTNISDYGFQECTGLTNIILAKGIATMGNSVFFSCTSLTNIMLPESLTRIGDIAFEACSSLVSIKIPNGVTNIGNQAFDICASLSQVTIPDGVSSIGRAAFYSCTSLESVTIGASVTNIGDLAFHDCTSLKAIYFRGNTPNLGANVFEFDNAATAYYLPKTQGWGASLGVPTVLWNPQMQVADLGFIIGNQFGFSIIGSSNIVFVVEACTDLTNPMWQPLQTNILSGGWASFSDPQWQNYRGRFYRLRGP